MKIYKFNESIGIHNMRQKTEYGDKIYICQLRDNDRDTFIIGKIKRTNIGLKIDGYIINDLYPQNNGKHVVERFHLYTLFAASPE
jgi:hypothetical protein